jgi:hypothetical protein
MMRNVNYFCGNNIVEGTKEDKNKIGYAVI